MLQKQSKSKVFSEILLAVLQIIGGILVGCVFLLMTFAQFLISLAIRSRSPAVWLLAGACLAALLLYCGIRKLALVSRFQKAASALEKSKGSVSLEELSARTNCSVEKLQTDLQIMIGRGYFFPPVQLDLYRGDLVSGSAIILPPVPDPDSDTFYKEVSRRPMTFWVPPAIVASVCYLLFPLSEIFLVVISGAVLFFSYRNSVPIRRLVETKKPREKARPVSTGDKDADQVLTEAKEQLDRLRYLSRSISGSPMDKTLSSLVSVGSDILAHVEENPDKLRQVRQFISYYLPTTVKLLQTYQEFGSQSAKGENIKRSMEKIENMMQDIEAAFRRELDNLYFDRAIDVSADIDVMQSMLRQEGISTGEVFNVDFGKDHNA